MMTLKLVTVGGDEVQNPGRISPRPQPLPYDTLVIVTEAGDQTGIVRYWNEGDSLRCELCPLGQCRARHNSCFLMVPGVVSPEAARLFDANALRWPERG